MDIELSWSVTFWHGCLIMIAISLLLFQITKYYGEKKGVYEIPKGESLERHLSSRYD